jgi:flagellar biosynthesis protein FlhB
MITITLIFIYILSLIVTLLLHEFVEELSENFETELVTAPLISTMVTITPVVNTAFVIFIFVMFILAWLDMLRTRLRWIIRRYKSKSSQTKN